MSAKTHAAIVDDVADILDSAPEGFSLLAQWAPGEQLFYSLIEIHNDEGRDSALHDREERDLILSAHSSASHVTWGLRDEAELKESA